LQGER